MNSMLDEGLPNLLDIFVQRKCRYLENYEKNLESV